MVALILVLARLLCWQEILVLARWLHRQEILGLATLLCWQEILVEARWLCWQEILVLARWLCWQDGCVGKIVLVLARDFGIGKRFGVGKIVCIGKRFGHWQEIWARWKEFMWREAVRLSSLLVQIKKTSSMYSTTSPRSDMELRLTCIPSSSLERNGPMIVSSFASKTWMLRP